MEWLQSDDFPFAYVVGLNSSVSSSMPLLISPVEKGKYAFDQEYAREHYAKRSVVLRVDMSVTDPQVGDRFLDWSALEVGDSQPKIVWPE